MIGSLILQDMMKFEEYSCQGGQAMPGMPASAGSSDSEVSQAQKRGVSTSNSVVLGISPTNPARCFGSRNVGAPALKLRPRNTNLLQKPKRK